MCFQSSPAVNEAPSVDQALRLSPYFSGLRPDERVRVGDRLSLTPLAPGESLVLSPAEPQMVFLVAGEAEAVSASSERALLFPGDSYGEIELVAGTGKDAQITAREDSWVVVVDFLKFEWLLSEYPVVYLPLVARLGVELKWRNDFLRDLLLARASRLPPEALRRVFTRERRLLARQRARPIRALGEFLGQVLFVEPASRPAFWVFVGASLALVSARTVVAMILEHGLQSKLFALIGTGAGNPIHVHHFNYGLLLVSSVGLVAMLPQARRRIRLLSFLFGFGAGLVVDEFALLWNLNPDYYQPSSRLAAALFLFALAQGVYFRGLYAAMARRLWGWVRS